MVLQQLMMAAEAIGIRVRGSTAARSRWRSRSPNIRSWAANCCPSCVTLASLQIRKTQQQATESYAPEVPGYSQRCRRNVAAWLICCSRTQYPSRPLLSNAKGSRASKSLLWRAAMGLWTSVWASKDIQEQRRLPSTQIITSTY